MKKIRAFNPCNIFIFGVMFVCLLLTYGSLYADDKKIELSYVDVYREKHAATINAIKPWIEEIQKKTNGQVVITYFAPGTIVPQKETYDGIVAGLVDIGSQHAQATPGKFPVNEVGTLPKLASSAEAGALMISDLYKRHPEWRDDFKETKILWQWVSASFQIHTTKKLVKTLDDLKGMRIIGWSPDTMEIIKFLGANPMQVKPPDTYLALERGMADGVACPFAPIKTLKINEATKYSTIANLQVATFYTAMNLDRWNSLPADIQKVFTETTGATMAAKTGQALDKGDMENRKSLESQGHTVYVLPPEEDRKWAKALTPIHAKWIKAAEKKGIKNARKIVEDAIMLGQKYGE